MASIVVQITGKSSAKISIVKINLCIELIQEKLTRLMSFLKDDSEVIYDKMSSE